MASDKAAEQVESTKPTATKLPDPSAGRPGGHKTSGTDDKATSGIVGAPFTQATAPRLNVKVRQIPIPKDGVSGAEQSDSCHNLFNTIELLEIILIKLPIKDLLFAQSVCKTWKNCIDHSKILQQGLFLVPPELKPVQMRYDLEEEDDLRTAHYKKASASDTGVVKFLRSCIDTCINPLLLSVFSRHALAAYLMDRSQSPRTEDAFTRPEASWKRMISSYLPLAITDVFLHVETLLQKHGDSMEAALIRLGPEKAAWCKEGSKKLARDGVALVFALMQQCATAEQLAREVDRLKQQEML